MPTPNDFVLHAGYRITAGEVDGVKTVLAAASMGSVFLFDVTVFVKVYVTGGSPTIAIGTALFPTLYAGTGVVNLGAVGGTIVPVGRLLGAGVHDLIATFDRDVGTGGDIYVVARYGKTSWDA